LTASTARGRTIDVLAGLTGRYAELGEKGIYNLERAAPEVVMPPAGARNAEIEGADEERPDDRQEVPLLYMQADEGQEREKDSQTCSARLKIEGRRAYAATDEQDVGEPADHARA
jgi:hypothetical protein